MRIGQYGSGIAFSQGVEKGSLAEVDNTTTTLLYATLISSDAARRLKMLVFDRLGFPLLFWHSAVQSTDTTLFIDTDAYVVQILSYEYFG